MILHTYYRIACLADAVTRAAVPVFARIDRTAARLWLAVAVVAVDRAHQAVDRLEQVDRR